MAYEREAIADTASAIPTAAPPIMREEVVYDPYRHTKTQPKALSAIGQADKTEGSAAVDAKPTEEPVKLSPQVAALARKEQRFRQQQQELEKARAALDAEKAEVAELKAMKAKLAAKDYSGLEGLVDYNEYSQHQISKLNGADPVKEEISKLNNKITELEKTTQNNISKQFEAAVSERRIATKELVDKTPEFARIKKANAYEAVVQHILDTWEHDSKELSVEDACKEVAEILQEKAQQWAALLEDEKPAAPEEEKKTLPPLKQGLKTLTNQVTAGDIKRPPKSLQHMNDAERWAEARRRAEEKLQKQS
jgi:hypothetical protein